MTQEKTFRRCWFCFVHRWRSSVKRILGLRLCLDQALCSMLLCDHLVCTPLWLRWCRCCGSSNLDLALRLFVYHVYYVFGMFGTDNFDRMEQLTTFLVSSPRCLLLLFEAFLDFALLLLEASASASAVPNCPLRSPISPLVMQHPIGGQWSDN